MQLKVTIDDDEPSGNACIVAVPNDPQLMTGFPLLMCDPCILVAPYAVLVKPRIPTETNTFATK